MQAEGEGQKPAYHASGKPDSDQGLYFSGANTTPVSPACNWSANLSALAEKPTPSSTLAADISLAEGIAGNGYYQPSTPQSDLVQYLMPDASSHTKLVQPNTQGGRIQLQPAEVVVAAAEGRATTDIILCSDATLRMYASNTCFTLPKDQLTSGGQLAAGMQRLLAVFDKEKHILYGLWVAVSTAPGQHGMQASNNSQAHAVCLCRMLVVCHQGCDLPDGAGCAFLSAHGHGR